MRAAVAATIGVALSLMLLGGCFSREASMSDDKVRELATQYTAAWCSQEAARVASHFTGNGTLKS